MKKRALTKSHRGAVATGATATGAAAAGAASFGALAMGAVALGAMAVGALAIGRLTVRRARLRRVEIGELTVGRLDVAAIGGAGRLTAIARLRAAPGEGEALEAHLLSQMAGSGPDLLFLQVHRSQTDPDLFLLQSSFPDDAAFERTQAALLETLLSRTVELGLVTASTEHWVESYRTI